jgi:hypothetical protein
MKKLVVLIITLILASMHPSILQATSLEVSGPVSGSWSVDTVFVTGDIKVESGESLTIGPGTLVLFTGHFKFTVLGSVVAAGTENGLIRFSISDTTGFADTLSATGSWHGFVYEHLSFATDSSVFEHCLFEYGKAFSADTFGMYGGAFRIFDFGRIAFRNCTFSNNLAIRWGGAVYARNADISLTSCTFERNRCGLALFPWGYGGGICSVESEPVVVGCWFEGNSATGFGGGASFEYSDPELHHNVFYDNFGGLAGGFGFLRSTPARVVSNNLVYANSARFFGGGAACIRANTMFSNNTIVNNQSMYGGGFYCNDSAVPVLYNTIIRGNSGFGHEVYIWDVRSAPSFLYCNVEGDTTDFEGSGAHEGYAGVYENNMDEDALFRGTGDFPFALQPGSPCVDAGTPDTSGLQVPITDLEGLIRVYNGRIDIGAFEWNPGQGVLSWKQAQAYITAFPNPCSELTLIRVSGLTGSHCRINIYDLNGCILWHSGELKVTGGQVELGILSETMTRIFTYEGIYIIEYDDHFATGSLKLIKNKQ